MRAVQGRTLAIGDIHGCAGALESLLDVVRPRPGDLVVTLGDYVDGGLDSAGVIERLLHLERRVRLVALLGNHDQRMLQARDDPVQFDLWMESGGQRTLASYSDDLDEDGLDDIPDRHWDFLERCRDFHETLTHIFVHASLHPFRSLEEQTERRLRWAKIRRPPPHVSGKMLVYGHTRQRSGQPLDLGYAVCIDTSVCRGGWLTCLDVDRRWIWQASERGRVRMGSLEVVACRG